MTAWGLAGRIRNREMDSLGRNMYAQHYLNDTGGGVLGRGESSGLAWRFGVFTLGRCRGAHVQSTMS